LNYFGTGLIAAGDLDGDGIGDLMVGSPGYVFGGAFYSVLMNADGTAKSTRVLSYWDNSYPTSASSEKFGASINSIGDLDGDSVPDFVVGSPGDDTNGTDRGAVRIINSRFDNTSPTLSVRR
jgi:glycosylphosphatidylinositol phospholipase D